MFIILLVDILNPKVVYQKGEINRAHLLPPEAWSVSGWDVSIDGQIFSDMVVG